jgi:lipoprotein-anchoring transpeptidase ErfK/SrfK
VKLKLSTQDAFGPKQRRAALTSRSFTARVVMRPYVANEPVVVRVSRSRTKLKTKTLMPRPIAGGTAAVATLKVRSRKPGRVLVRAEHVASPALPALRAKTIAIQVVRPPARPGARGPAVRLLQSKLAKLRYAVPRSGVYDAGTANAVMAWRKMVGKPRTIYATRDVFAGLLRGRGRFHVRHPRDGRHVEARIDKQVLALIDEGKVRRIYHISSGAPATPTVRGRFRVYLKTPGTNAKGMLDSNYFIRGYAIHGYYSVPPYNASHGCLRVPLADARHIYNWLRIGDVVWVEG